jgi:hypothetical protein
MSMQKDTATDKAVTWASTSLEDLEGTGTPHQEAVNDVLVTVARVWGPECAHEVEHALHIQFQMPHLN